MLSNTAEMGIMEPCSAVFKAPLFAELIQQFRLNTRCRVLDLGQAQSACIEMFNLFQSHLYIANLHQHITHAMLDNNSADIEAMTDDILSIPADSKKFNLVLCWDLLNYLDVKRIAFLFKAIRYKVEDDVMIHALIKYSNKTMHTLPDLYFPYAKVNPDESIVYDSLAQVTLTMKEKTAPQYSPETLTRAMSDFKIDKVRLLGNGMQEFIFKLRQI